jgi:hypothetical protein
MAIAKRAKSSSSEGIFRINGIPFIRSASAKHADNVIYLQDRIATQINIGVITRFILDFIDKLKVRLLDTIKECVAVDKLSVSESDIEAAVDDCASRIATAAGLAVPAAKVVRPSASPAVPETWEEAKAQVHGLMKWSDAKADARDKGRRLSIVDHLRDTEHGYGRWTLSEPGLPRAMLKQWNDFAAYTAIYSYLRNHELPSDIYIPAEDELKKPTPIVKVDPEALKAAYRLIKQAARDRHRG